MGRSSETHGRTIRGRDLGSASPLIQRISNSPWLFIHSWHRWGQVQQGFLGGAEAKTVAAFGVNVYLGRNFVRFKARYIAMLFSALMPSSPAWAKKMGGVCALTRISGER